MLNLITEIVCSWSIDVGVVVIVNVVVVDVVVVVVVGCKNMACPQKSSPEVRVWSETRA